MRLNRAAPAIAIATVAVASAAIVSGCETTQPGAVSVTHSAQQVVSAQPASTHRASAQLATTQRPASLDPSLAWLESAGGQAQLAFNDDVDTLAAALQTEMHAPTVHNLAAYKRMLNDFITVANLLQPGRGYGTTAQDWAAWYKALNASNITVY